MKIHVENAISAIIGAALISLPVVLWAMGFPEFLK
jgi:hypothetical protein